MTEDVYERLAQQLEAQPEGLPRNENGLEMKMLRRIFTEEEAEIRTHMRLLPAPAQEIAKRLGRDPEEMATKLERMVENGQIYGFGPRGNRTYSASPFMFGIYQFQLNRLDPELVELAKQYVHETWGAAQSAMTPKNMRVIPVNVGVEAESQALPYDDAREMVEEGKSFRVMDCICRKEAKILGKGCDHTLENCLLVSSNEDEFDLFYWGRSITKQEALEIVENAEKEGLVHTTLNYANDSMRNLCNCCSCACFQLDIINNLDQLNGLARSQFNAQIDSALCDQEGACAEACPVDAISEGENAYCVDLERCIGCGVCVTACPTHAVSMVLKPEDARTTPPNSLGDWMVERLKERGSSIDEIL